MCERRNSVLRDIRRIRFNTGGVQNHRMLNVIDAIVTTMRDQFAPGVRECHIPRSDLNIHLSFALSAYQHASTLAQRRRTRIDTNDDETKTGQPINEPPAKARRLY